MVIIFVTIIRVRLLDVPLERDEGEYAYSGQLILQGIPPYEKAYNMKMPGIYAAYALILAIFGQTHTGIHLGLLFINAATTVLVFLLAKDLFDPVAGLVASSAYALLSIGQHVQGFSANAEHFVVLPALAGILLLRKAIGLQKYLLLFVGGLLLGTAFMMKQHGVVFIVFGGLYLLSNEVRHRPFNWKLFINKSVLFSAGVFLPFISTCVILWWAGVFERFWFWTFDYAREYVLQVPFSIWSSLFWPNMANIVNSAGCLWGMVFLGLVSLFLSVDFRTQRLFTTGFLILSFLAVCLGLHFWAHYFIFLLPASALLAGVAVVFIHNKLVRSRLRAAANSILVTLSVFIFLHTVYKQQNYFFSMTPTEVSYNAYGGNTFPEILEVARYIRENSSKDNTIAVLGSEPQIYFYSQRHSATGYIYMYALMEKRPYALEMQREMANQIESASPKFMIFVHVFVSWIPEEYSENFIFSWFEQYVQKYYYRVGVVDIFPSPPAVYNWGKEASAYEPHSDAWISIFQRKE